MNTGAETDPSLLTPEGQGGRLRSHLGSLTGYGLSVLVSAVVTLATIPILIAHSDAQSWAALAVGQAVGTGGAMLIGYGWGATGPTAVAKANAEGRRQIYVDSFRGRMLLALPVGALAVWIVFLAAPRSPLEASLNAGGYCLTGLLAGWYFTGAARPYLFLLLDTMPRVAGAIAGAAAVMFGAPLIAFPALQALGILLGVLASTKYAVGAGSRLFRGFRLGAALVALRSQSHGVAIAIVVAANVAVPASIVAFVAPVGLPAYAMVDKLLRFGTTSYAPIVQFLQGWVPPGSERAVRRKARAAFCAGVILSVLGAAGFAVLAPLLSVALSHGKIEPSLSLILGFALILALMEMSQFTGLVCLLALGRARKLALFSVVGMCVTLLGVLLGAVLFGAPGAAWMLAGGELVGLAPQVALLRKALHGERLSPARDAAAPSI